MKLFSSADILLPERKDMQKWSVVACDQYTSQTDYWEDVFHIVEQAPSTLHMILPEIYLESGDAAERIKRINTVMERYQKEGLFRTFKDAFLYVERTAPGKKTRKGVVGAVDLEQYSYDKKSGSPIRATEGTVLERIPPRMDIRRNASLECPHIMLLVDDEEKEIIEPLAKEKLECVYDFTLMKNGGQIKGFLVPNKLCEKVSQRIVKLMDKEYFKKKYHTQSEEVLVLAVGDGNHSLATAKACWEEKKKSLSEKERENHPARFALVELVNLHDESLVFEPIHRVVFDCDTIKLLEYLGTLRGRENHEVTVVFQGVKRQLLIDKEKGSLAVGALQNALDEYLVQNQGRIDYIHGEDVTVSLSKKDNVGFLLPAMKKSDLFLGIIHDGALPRKTFSMGEAFEKRFYLECRKIKI